MKITIGDMIDILESIDLTTEITYKFKNPHSYRGMYNCAAVEPTDEYVSVRDMIDSCYRLLNETFEGWKGGDYTYDRNTPLFFAERGRIEPFVGYHDYDLDWGSPEKIRIFFYELIHDVKVKVVY